MVNIKGIILAGGTGTRLHPLTKTTNKHLLPIYDKQMIFYPLETLKKSGIKDITIVSGPGHAGQFLELLASGYDMGLNLSYTIQEKPLGIAHGIWVALRELGKQPVAVILGDNIFENTFKYDIQKFKKGAKVFLFKVHNPEQFGIAKMENKKITKIIEKPTTSIGNFAVTGFYLFDEQAYDFIEKIPVSKRGEVEITDLNNLYIENDLMNYKILKRKWMDVGTLEGIFKASMLRRVKSI